MHEILESFPQTWHPLFVSHDTGAVINLCDRAILLENGVTSAERPPKYVCELYLKSIYASQQAVDNVTDINSIKKDLPDAPQTEVIDQRLEYLNCSQYRNDIELFSFDPKSDSFGRGGAYLVDVKIMDVRSNKPVNWVVGGEKVSLVVLAETEIDLKSPIIGFMFRDRLGQDLFGDNTYLTHMRKPPHFGQGSRFAAQFTFRMPVLPPGSYTIQVALAEVCRRITSNCIGFMKPFCSNLIPAASARD